jgi:hypothetical protein
MIPHSRAILVLAAVLVTIGVAAAQTWSRNPTYGTWTLVARSSPAARTVSVQAGGSIDASRTLGRDCPGSVSDAPDYRVNYTPGGFPLSFAVRSQADTTLVINAPDGRWYCNDDGGGNFNPLVRFDRPRAGQYDVWVGTYLRGRPAPAELEVFEALSEADRQQAARAERGQREAAARLERERIEALAAEQRRQEQLAAEAAAAEALEARRQQLVSRFGATQAEAILAGQVQNGMTGEAVREALGEPRRIERAGLGEEMWTYDYVRVVLLNNRVTFVRPLS